MIDWPPIEGELDRVCGALAALRLSPVRREVDLHRAIQRRLDEVWVSHLREVALGRRSRIDFLTTYGVGIEAKVGKPNCQRVTDQLRRYAQCDEVRGLVLVSERGLVEPPTAADLGVPFRYLALVHNWGVTV